MDKKSKPEAILFEHLRKLRQGGIIPARYEAIISDFVSCYRDAIETAGRSFESAIPIFQLFFQLVKEQFAAPHSFEPYHQKVRAPIDYYKFGIDFIAPLVDREHSNVLGMENLKRIQEQIARKENVIFLANHQTETDPQAISILLEPIDSKLAEQIIYVAGERVVTDPLAIPFSLGTDLLCIYSKRYIDHPPELKAQKLHHNKQTMERMSRLLQEGGKAIYVAPSGGRDRRDSSGKIAPALFDGNSIELFYLMAKKAKTPTHFYPMALATYDLLPPPETVQRELGEKRMAKRTSIHLYFGPEIEMDRYPGSDAADKEAKRKARADAIWSTVNELYEILKKN